jgi:hypothetical protein
MAMLLQRDQILQLLQRRQVGAHKSTLLINISHIIAFADFYIVIYSKDTSFAGKAPTKVLTWNQSSGPSKDSRVIYVYF